MDWGDLAIAAWKKGGPVACGAGGAAGLVYPSPWRGSGGRDAVSPASSQSVGDGRRDVAACRRSDRAAGCWSARCCRAGHVGIDIGQPTVAAALRPGRQRQCGRFVAACGTGGRSRDPSAAGSGVDAGLEPWQRGVGPAAHAGDGGQGIATMGREYTAGRRGSGCGGQHYYGVGPRERLLRVLRSASAKRRVGRESLPEPADRGGGRSLGFAIQLHRYPLRARPLCHDDPRRTGAPRARGRVGGALRASSRAPTTPRS